MRRFAELLERLAFTPSRNAKLRLITDYLRTTPDPDRGWALAALTGGLDVAAVKPALLRDVTTQRVDAELFAPLLRLRRRPRRDHRADLAGDRPRRRPVARRGRRHPARHLAPRGPAGRRAPARPPRRLRPLRAAEARHRRPPRRRLRPPRQAGARRPRRPRGHRDRGGLARPRAALRRPLRLARPAAAARPAPAAAAPFRPVMLSHPLEAADLERLDPADYAAEWKWDGIRVQAVAEAGRRRLYSRTGDDISGAFPDLVEALAFDAALDGELLVRQPDGGPIASFSDLQQRLNRKTVTPPTCAATRRTCAPTTSCTSATATCARCPSPSAAPPSRPSPRPSTRPASTSRRCSPSPPATTSRASAPPRPTRSSRASC